MAKPLIGIEVQSHAMVRALALETKQPLEKVRSVYEQEFRRLDCDARIKTYLPIFAARHARRILTGH